MTIAQMERAADAVSGYMKLLACPSRLMVLCQLADGEKSVSELCDLVGMKPPAMSQQLARLRREDVLAARRDARSVYYSIVDPNISAIMAFLYETFCGPEARQRPATRSQLERSKSRA